MEKKTRLADAARLFALNAALLASPAAQARPGLPPC